MYSQNELDDAVASGGRSVNTCYDACAVAERIEAAYAADW